MLVNGQLLEPLGAEGRSFTGSDGGAVQVRQGAVQGGLASTLAITNPSINLDIEVAPLADSAEPDLALAIELSIKPTVKGVVQVSGATCLPPQIFPPWKDWLEGGNFLACFACSQFDALAFHHFLLRALFPVTLSPSHLHRGSPSPSPP